MQKVALRGPGTQVLELPMAQVPHHHVSRGGGVELVPTTVYMIVSHDHLHSTSLRDLLSLL